MPRIDPMTGCEVMTMPEFLNDQAEREGKGRTGGDVLTDIYEKMDEDNARVEAELHKPVNALVAIQQAIKDAREYWDDDEGKTPLPEIVEVRSVREVRCSQSFRDSGQVIRAEVVGADHALYYVDFAYSHSGGTMWEPPDEDSNLNIGKFDKVSKPFWTCFVCGRVRVKGERHWSHVRQSDDPSMAVHSCPRCNGYERKMRRKLRRSK